MMISPGAYYDRYIKGKSKKGVLRVIHKLEHEIEELKKDMEDPDKKLFIEPSESVQISCIENYLELAKKELERFEKEKLKEAAR